MLWSLLDFRDQIAIQRSYDHGGSEMDGHRFFA
jgi:hypothetical protein